MKGATQSLPSQGGGTWRERARKPINEKSLGNDKCHKTDSTKNRTTERAQRLPLGPAVVLRPAAPAIFVIPKTQFVSLLH